MKYCSGVVCCSPDGSIEQCNLSFYFTATDSLKGPVFYIACVCMGVDGFGSMNKWPLVESISVVFVKTLFL